LYENKIVERKGNCYHRDFFYTEKKIDFFCMLFVFNKDYHENEYAKIYLERNNRIIESKRYHILNNNPYDGWYLFEKNI